MSSRVLTWSPESQSWDGQPLNNGTISLWGLMIFLRLGTIIWLVGLKKQLGQKCGLKWVLTQWSNSAKQARFSPPSNTLCVEVQRPFIWGRPGQFLFWCHSCLWSSHKPTLWTSNVLHWSVENNNPSHEKKWLLHSLTGRWARPVIWNADEQPRKPEETRSNLKAILVWIQGEITI